MHTNEYYFNAIGSVSTSTEVGNVQQIGDFGELEAEFPLLELLMWRLILLHQDRLHVGLGPEVRKLVIIMEIMIITL